MQKSGLNSYPQLQLMKNIKQRKHSVFPYTFDNSFPVNDIHSDVTQQLTRQLS